MTPSSSCCRAMAEQLEMRCSDHDDPWDCPDQLVAGVGDGRLGLPVHDGGSSYVGIAFCPWCGTNLATDGGSSLE